jgi:hypothetical protein
MTETKPVADQLREALQERAELAALKRQLRLQSLGLTIRMWGCRVRLLCLAVLGIPHRR